MRAFLARRTPSPAMAVAFVALLAALSGTAIALPGKNSVDKNDIRKGAVRGKAIAKNAVTGAKVKKGAIRSADVGNNSLTGADVNEGTLAQVPSAASATAATTADSVGGVSFRSFNYNVDNDGPATQILDFGGLTLTASCALDILALSAGSSVADTEIGSYSVEADGGAAPQNSAYSGDLDPGGSVNLVPNDEDEEVGSLRYTKPDGTGVHVQFHIWGGDNGAAGGRCAVNGVASAF
jgi:hypothetical protein